MKLFIAHQVRRVLRFLVARSSADSELYLREAGIDVDGLTRPEPSARLSDRRAAS